VFGSVLLDQFGDTEYCYLWATSLATHIRAEIGEGGSGGGGISRRSIIHDYVFLAFLLGNDFLPHIPSMRFRNDGMDKLLEAMRDIREPLILPNPLFPDTRVLVRYLTRLSQDEISVLHGNNMRQVKLIESYRRGTLKFLMDADTPEKKYAAELE
jgi:hypothetical protein